MSGQDDSGDKTEEPTPKKLQDARKKGQVAKSKDITSTVELVTWFLLAVLAVRWAGNELVSLLDSTLALIGQPFYTAAPALGAHAMYTLLALSAGIFVPVLAVGLLTEYLQVGPLLALERLQPKFENIDPVGGIKRMFSLDNLVELAKSLVKTALLLVTGTFATMELIPQLVLLPWSGHTEAVGLALWSAARPILLWAVGLLTLLSVVDIVHQRWSFRKKMRMSMRDIRQEHKEMEGDPHIKGMRQQLAREWSRQGAVKAARDANVIVVNPTHVAIAIEYHRETCPVPTVIAKGVDDVAMAMRDAAAEEGIPVLRNVALARDLLSRVEEGDAVPSDLFDVIAEVILWAKQVREELLFATLGENVPHGVEKPEPVPEDRRRQAPGEDLTQYPHDFKARQGPGSPDGSPGTGASPWPPRDVH